jgi:hypothetical protein
MQISKQLKKGQNKKDIEKFEKQLEDLKSSTDDGDIIKGKILELENLIKKYYTQKAEAAKIRSRNIIFILTFCVFNSISHVQELISLINFFH